MTPILIKRHSDFRSPGPFNSWFIKKLPGRHLLALIKNGVVFATCACNFAIEFRISLFLPLCPPRYFHGRAQPSSLDSFFERALSLVSEVVRIMNSSENDEGALEYCTARLESLLTNCVNLFHLLEEGLYNQLIDSIQYYLSLLGSDELLNFGRSDVIESLIT